jgi:CRP/FNR family transcriptional regulator, polysaccharide utilization system transcription regulator
MKKDNAEVSCATCHARTQSIFKGLNIDETNGISTAKSCSKFKKGQYIFSENAYPLGLYCINHGKVKLTVQGVNGKEQIVRLLKDGDVVGYRSLLSNEKYHCSAIALEDSSICFVPKDTLFDMIKENSKVSFELLKLLSNNLKKQKNKLYL